MKKLAVVLLTASAVLASGSYALGASPQHAAADELAKNFVGPGYIAEATTGGPKYSKNVNGEWYVSVNGVTRRIIQSDRTAPIYMWPGAWISRDGKRLVLRSSDEGYQTYSLMVEIKTKSGLAYTSIYNTSVPE